MTSAQTHVPRYGPEEIALRHEVDRLSIMVSAARSSVTAGSLAHTVVHATYPAILQGVGKCDQRRARSRQFFQAQTEASLRDTEGDARLLNAWADTCQTVLRRHLAGEVI